LRRLGLTPRPLAVRHRLVEASDLGERHGEPRARDDRRNAQGAAEVVLHGRRSTEPALEALDRARVVAERVVGLPELEAGLAHEARVVQALADGEDLLAHLEGPCLVAEEPVVVGDPVEDPGETPRVSASPREPLGLGKMLGGARDLAQSDEEIPRLQQEVHRASHHLRRRG
jgi:hypothetical protein